MPTGTSVAAPDVELLDVTKRFGEVVAVDAMTLQIPSGSFTSLLGPSGCGKTTTLRMIAGFEQPTEGEILLAGQPIAGVPPYQRNVNTVFQHYALFPHMDVAQNVGYGLRQKKVGKDEERRRVGEALELVRLGGYEQAPDLGDVGRPAAARRARPGPREPADRAAPRRAARRARPQAAQGDAARAQGPPAGGRDHVRVRDPRPGRGADDERRHRRHARRPDPAAWAARPSSTSGRSTGSSPTSSASRTPSPGTVVGARRRRTAGRRRADRGPAAPTAASPTRRRPAAGDAGRRRGPARSACEVEPADGAPTPEPDRLDAVPGRIHQGTYLGDQTEYRVNTDAGGRARSSAARTPRARAAASGLGPGDPVVVRWHEEANLVLVA